MTWISIELQPMPLEKYIIVKHAAGVEAICYFGGWKYWYAGNRVKKELLNNITHWCEPSYKPTL